MPAMSSGGSHAVQATAAGQAAAAARVANGTAGPSFEDWLALHCTARDAILLPACLLALLLLLIARTIGSPPSPDPSWACEVQKARGLTLAGFPCGASTPRQVQRQREGKGTESRGGRLSRLAGWLAVCGVCVAAGSGAVACA